MINIETKILCDNGEYLVTIAIAKKYVQFKMQ